MPQIPEYFRNQLASERTGIPSADKSGVIIADAVRDLSDTFIKGITALEVQQKRVLDDSRRAKMVGEYTSQLIDQENQIKTQYFSEPDKAVEELAASRSRLRDDFLGQIEEGDFRLEFSNDVERINAEAMVKDAAWKIGQSSYIAQRNYSDRINADARFLGKSSYIDYIIKAENLLHDRQNAAQTFGGYEAGDKVVEDGLKAYTRAFVYGQIDQGNAFEAAQLVSTGKFDAFISPDEKHSLLKQTQTAYDGQVKKDNFLQAVQSGGEIFEMSGRVVSDDVTLSELEERLSGISFQLANSEADRLSPEQVASLDLQRDALSKLRDVKVQGIALTAKDDSVVKSELLSRFQNLIGSRTRRVKKGKETISEKQDTLIGSVEDTLNFQRDLVTAYYDGKVSKDTFNRYMTITEAAVQNDFTNVLKPKGEGFKAPNNPLLSQTKSIRKSVQKLFEDTPNVYGAQYALDTFDFYLDELYDVTGGDKIKIDLMQPKDFDTLAANAKMKAALKRLGYPVYLTIGDKVTTALGSFEIKARDADGTPLVDVSQLPISQ